MGGWVGFWGGTTGWGVGVGDRQKVGHAQVTGDRTAQEQSPRYRSSSALEDSTAEMTGRCCWAVQSAVSKWGCC